MDDLVKGVVIGRMSMPDALDFLLGDDAEARRWSERVDEIGRRLADAADAFADGAITAEQLRRITARLQPELDEAEQRRAASVVSLDLDALRPLAGPQAGQRWDEMTVAQRRAVLGALGLRVIIDRTRPGPGFDPESVRFAWGSRRAGR